MEYILVQLVNGLCRGSIYALMAIGYASIEMALSRGGDQAVIKNKFSFDFIGGKAGEVESSNKVRSRVMANALESLIKDASRVLVMGHKFSDMDSIGGAVGVCSLARKNGKQVHIVADTEKSYSLRLAPSRPMPMESVAWIPLGLMT